jgi:hypothetical protein
MHPARLATKIQGQIEGFSGKLSKGVSKPAARMIREVLVGIQARGSVRLSEIARALDEPVAMKKVIERLGRHLNRGEVRERVRQNLVALGAPRVGEETLVVVDLTDISKPHARRMEHLARVRDGSTGELTPGYWCCQVVAVEPNSSEVVPLYQQLYSHRSPEFTCVYLGREAKLRVLAAHAFQASKRIFGMAAFRFYAVADGIQHALFGRTRPVRPSKPPPPSPNLSLFPGAA